MTSHSPSAPREDNQHAWGEPFIDLEMPAMDPAERMPKLGPATRRSWNIKDATVGQSRQHSATRTTEESTGEPNTRSCVQDANCSKKLYAKEKRTESFALIYSLLDEVSSRVTRSELSMETPTPVESVTKTQRNIDSSNKIDASANEKLQKPWLYGLYAMSEH